MHFHYHKTTNVDVLCGLQFTLIMTAVFWKVDMQLQQHFFLL